MTVANKKFKELLAQLENQVVSESKPEPAAGKASAIGVKKSPTLSAEIVEQIFGQGLPKDFPKDVSMAKKVATHPNPQLVKAKVKQENAANMVLMPISKVEDWLVQVYPDDDCVLHFQAKSSAQAQTYTRWYKIVDAELYKQITAIYLKADAYKRPSFYGSDKQYLVCSRVDDKTVAIPGYGNMELPELFAK